MLGIVGVGTRIEVHEVALERAVDQNRQFARRGGDRFGLANPRRQSPIERACIGGAMQIGDYTSAIEASGLRVVHVRDNPQYRYATGDILKETVDLPFFHPPVFEYLHSFGQGQTVHL